jgi:type VI protein secretion system component VasK
MSSPVKAILTILAALMLLGFLWSLLSSVVVYVLLATGAIAVLWLLGRCLFGHNSRTIAAAVRAPHEKKVERKAERELKELERRVHVEPTPSPTITRTGTELETEQQKLGRWVR